MAQKKCERVRPSDLTAEELVAYLSFKRDAIPKKYTFYTYLVGCKIVWTKCQIAKPVAISKIVHILGFQM